MHCGDLLLRNEPKTRFLFLEQLGWNNYICAELNSAHCERVEGSDKERNEAGEEENRNDGRQFLQALPSSYHIIYSRGFNASFSNEQQSNGL